MGKKLQPASEYEKYDMDGDGVVTDEELEHAKEIRETERDLRKSLAQLRMARWTLIGMGAFTAGMFSLGSASSGSKRCQRSATYFTYRARALSARTGTTAGWLGNDTGIDRPYQRPCWFMDGFKD